ncbi:MAG TPA: hypothetical protein VLK36_05190 [Gaiellaceae bacterium]|nr:hypothetical protein [Gaiellaceae bacterium]
MRSGGIAALVVGLTLVLAALGAASVEASASAVTPTATQKTWRPVQVVTALRQAGLPIGLVRYYTASSDPNKLLGRPGQYNGKANFRDQTLSGTGFDVENGGSVETFSNLAAARRRFNYVSHVTESSPLLTEYDYLEGTVFLRLSHELTPKQAKVYEGAFRRAV